LQASYLEVTEWVSRSVAAISPHVITNSFTQCGIAGDGSFSQLHSRLRALVDPAFSFEPSSDEEELVDLDDEDEGSSIQWHSSSLSL
jgi:hypothetical protein